MVFLLCECLRRKIHTLRTGINGGYGTVHDAAYSVLSAVDEETVIRLVAR